MPARKTIEVRTPNVPEGKGRPVDAAKYEAMRKILLQVLPRKAPGLTQAEMGAAVKAAGADFPGPPMWWMKCVQLDLETRGVLAREKAKPLRWHRIK